MLHFLVLDITPWRIRLRSCPISTAPPGNSCPPPLPRGMDWPFWQWEPPILKVDPEERVHTWCAEVRGRRLLYRLMLNVVLMGLITCEGTKKPAPAPPKQASPLASQPNPSHHPPIIPRRNSSKDALIQSPSYPPPQPPQAHQGESEPSPPSTPTPPDTPPHDSSTANPLSSYNFGSLPRPSRPAPRPRPRPSIPPPPQPAANDISNDNCGSASKIITGNSRRRLKKRNGAMLRQHVFFWWFYDRYQAKQKHVCRG